MPPSHDYIKKVNQFMIHHGCVGADELLVFLQNLIVPNGTESVTQLDEEKVFRIVQQVNKKLKKFDLMIRSAMDEYTTRKYYVLISTVDNEITRASSLYSPKQLEFFKLLLQAIVYESRGIISDSDMKVLATNSSLATIARSRGQLPEYRSLFNDWCNKNWFSLVSEDGQDYITLGVRAIAELDVFIKQKLVEKPDDLNCRGCNSMSIYSSYCRSCESRYHKRCAKMYINDDGKCRSC